jgi:hypothetical protein
MAEDRTLYKLVLMHSVLIAEDGNDMAFPVYCKDEEHILVEEDEVLFATFLLTSWYYRCD